VVGVGPDRAFPAGLDAAERRVIEHILRTSAESIHFAHRLLGEDRNDSLTEFLKGPSLSPTPADV
jgi:hypothetical protein